MARIQTSSLITDIDGKIKGSVFQKNASGIILRNQPGIINRRTSGQQDRKTGNQLCQSIWSQLSTNDLNAWKAYALYRNVAHNKNPALHLSAQQLFLKENMLRYAVSLFLPSVTPNIISTPTIKLQPDILTLTTLRNTASTLIVTFDRAVSTHSTFVALKMSRPLSNSQESQYNKLALIKFGDVGGASTNITTAYENIYTRIPTTAEWVNYEVEIGNKTISGISQKVKGRIKVTA